MLRVKVYIKFNSVQIQLFGESSGQSDTAAEDGSGSAVFCR